MLGSFNSEEDDPHSVDSVEETVRDSPVRLEDLFKLTTNLALESDTLDPLGLDDPQKLLLYTNFGYNYQRPEGLDQTGSDFSHRFLSYIDFMIQYLMDNISLEDYFIDGNIDEGELLLASAYIDQCFKEANRRSALS